MEPAIRVDGVSKRYRVPAAGAGAYMTIKESVAAAVTAPVRRLRSGYRPDPAEEFWSLKDVSFEVPPGEVVGIIGRNGAGKSTLLKILSRITKPTEGRVEINGRVGSLLEVGTGFHPELTGRENVYLNGSILGMSRREIAARFDEIVAFSGVEAFLDTVVKRYSSGMYVRLAFAVAAHLEPEVLIVDEVLAVGDAEFQKRCLGKMRDLSASGGRTVLLVSHNMDAILSLCEHAVLLSGGRAGAMQPASEAVNSYLAEEVADEARPLRDRTRSQSSPGGPFLVGLTVRSKRGDGANFPSGDEVTFDIELENMAGYTGVVCAVVILTERGQRVLMFHTLYHSDLAFDGGPRVRLRCVVPSLPLTPGEYKIELAVGTRDVEGLERVDHAGRLTVYFDDLFGTGRIPTYRQGHVALPAAWRIVD